MSIAIIINPISGGVAPDAARARAELARPSLDACGEPVEVFVTEAARPRARARRRGRAARRPAGDRLGRRRHDQRGRVGAGVRRRAARHHPGRIGQRPRARARRRSRAGSVRSPTRSAPRRARSTRASSSGRLFVNVAGIGFDAHVASRFDRWHRRRGFSATSASPRATLATYVPTTYRDRRRRHAASVAARSS